MSKWTSGYVADVEYTSGYYQELNPNRVKLAFLNKGLIPPEIRTACELGFGQGVSTNIHAAASVCSWYGTDFNPSQAGFARQLAALAGVNAQLYDESFAEFSERELPDFDYIGLHGVMSWISDENRKVIVEFIKKRLKVGGVLYISYNTLPGWSSFEPIRHIMSSHSQLFAGAATGIVPRIENALGFTQKLISTNPIFTQANTHVEGKFQQIKNQSRDYLAHEYFNRDWQPMHFGTMAQWLEPAKLTYACSAHYIDHLDVAHLTAEQQSFLADIHDPLFKQTVRDFMVNQQFRRDYWVKGARRLSPLDQTELLKVQRFVMTAALSEVSLKVEGSLGDAILSENIYAPILELMSDYKVRSMMQIEDALKGKAINMAQLTQAILVLCGKGAFSSAQDDQTITYAKPFTDNLNLYLVRKARDCNDINYLASPVTGGGLPVGRFQQLFILAIQQGMNKAEEWASFVSQILNAQGHKIVKDGQQLVTPEEHMAELTKQAHEFAAKKLPILKALQIV